MILVAAESRTPHRKDEGVINNIKCPRTCIHEIPIIHPEERPDTGLVQGEERAESEGGITRREIGEHRGTKGDGGGRQ